MIINTYLITSIHLTRIACQACFQKKFVVVFMKHDSGLLEIHTVGVIT